MAGLPGPIVTATRSDRPEGGWALLLEVVWPDAGRLVHTIDRANDVPPGKWRAFAEHGQWMSLPGDSGGVGSEYGQAHFAGTKTEFWVSHAAVVAALRTVPELWG